MVAGHAPTSQQAVYDVEEEVIPTGRQADAPTSQQAVYNVEEEVIPTSCQADAPLGSENTGEQKGRKKSFSTAEDISLVVAWLNVNLDQVVGTNQTRVSYWARITEFFHTHKTFESDRNESSLIHRWQHIQAKVNNFCGYYDGVLRRAQSGTTDSNKVTMALATFEAGGASSSFCNAGSNCTDSASGQNYSQRRSRRQLHWPPPKGPQPILRKPTLMIRGPWAGREQRMQSTAVPDRDMQPAHPWPAKLTLTPSICFTSRRPNVTVRRSVCETREQKSLRHLVGQKWRSRGDLGGRS